MFLEALHTNASELNISSLHNEALHLFPDSFDFYSTIHASNWFSDILDLLSPETVVGSDHH